MPYEIQLIGPEESRELFTRYESRFLYTAKCELHGTCIRPLTDQEVRSASGRTTSTACRRASARTAG